MVFPEDRRADRRPCGLQRGPGFGMVQLREPGVRQRKDAGPDPARIPGYRRIRRDPAPAGAAGRVYQPGIPAELRVQDGRSRPAGAADRVRRAYLPAGIPDLPGCQHQRPFFHQHEVAGPARPSCSGNDGRTDGGAAAFPERRSERERHTGRNPPGIHL